MHCRVRDLMTTDIEICTPGETLHSLMERMTQRRCRHLPVMENGALLGIVSIGDVVKCKIELAEREAQALKEYISS